MPKVSIIVPVYKVEKYLRKCLDSLVNQTMQDIEIILVNDASPDGSDVIMREYGRDYPEKVKCIFLEENVRQGGARNKGLATAKGEYISFVDGDDWLDLDFVEKLYNKANETGSDIVYADFMVDKGERSETRPNIYPQLCGVQDEKKHKMNLLMTGTGPCACVIKKALLLGNRLLFTEKMVYEDMAVCPLYSYYAGRLDYVGQTYYYYFQREDSVTHDMDAEYQKEEAKALLLLLKECDRRGITEKYPKEVEAMFTKYFYAWGMYGIYHGKFSSLPKDYMKCLAEEMHKRFPDYQNNPYFYGNIEPDLIQYMFENDRTWLGQSADGVISYANYYCQKQVSEKLIRLFEKIKGKRTALWGAGKKGREFLKAAGSLCTVGYVIDKQEALEGKYMETGEVIYGPKAGLEMAEVVLVVNKNYYEEIKRVVKKTNENISIVNLDIYLLSEFSVEECLE